MGPRRFGSTAAPLVAIGLLIAGCGRLPAVQQQARHDVPQPSVARAVQRHGLPVFVSRDRRGSRLWKLTQQFYQTREYRPVWIDGASVQRRADDLIAALKRADRDGLNPDFYSASVLEDQRAHLRDGDVAMTFDVWLTYEYLRFASDLAAGLTDVPRNDPDWRIRPAAFDPLNALDEALARNRIAPSLEALRPPHPQYRALCDTLAKYRSIARSGGWPALPDTVRLKPGQTHPAIAVLERRLALTGDYTGAVREDDAVYGPDLQLAVKHFQQRHGLTPNAIVGETLVAELNVPAETRVRQIELNLDRWRWLPHDLGDRYVFVNIPEYRLEVWDRRNVALAMRVVVGRKDMPTPIFTQAMTHVVFAPYWNIPPDIVQKETLPSLLKNPDFLERTNMEVIDRRGKPIDPETLDLGKAAEYRFRQRPGASNSLGLVKFLFPNPYNVYLHDTPAESLFGRVTRSLSHGCVRLEEPERLAEYVLSDQPEWTADRIQQAMHGADQKTVKLRTPVPVYLGYFTARVDSDGIVQFRRDIYGIDTRQAAQLSAAETRDGATATAVAAQVRPSKVAVSGAS